MPFKEFTHLLDFPSIGLMIVSLAALGSVIGVLAAATTLIYNFIRIREHYKSKNKKENE
jgi:hypothetical protein